MVGFAGEVLNVRVLSPQAALRCADVMGFRETGSDVRPTIYRQRGIKGSTHVFKKGWAVFRLYTGYIVYRNIKW